MPVGVGAKPAGGGAPVAKPGAPAKPVTPPAAPPAGAEPAKKGGKKTIVIVVLIVLILAVVGVGVFLALKMMGVIGGGGEPAPEATEKSLVLGEMTVSTGEPLSINLDQGYMSFAATIYFDDTVSAGGEGGGEIDPSPARDAALRLFKGMKQEDLNKAGAVTEMQKKYIAELNKSEIPPYDGHVVMVQFTTFAYQ